MKKLTQNLNDDLSVPVQLLVAFAIAVLTYALIWTPYVLIVELLFGQVGTRVG